MTQDLGISRDLPLGPFKRVPFKWCGLTLVTNLSTSDEFPIPVGLHQGSILIPKLFVLILDVIIFDIQEYIPCCMLFANDVGLIDHTRERVQVKLELWWKALEDKHLNLIRTKIESMEYKFKDRSTDQDKIMAIH